MNLRFIKASEKKKIAGILENDYGISRIPYLLIESGKEKIRGFSGSLMREQIMELADIARVEIVGLYLFRKGDRGEIRLGLDGASVFASQINKNVVELSDDEVEKWMKGEDLLKKESYGMKVIVHDGDFLGCGKSTGEKIINFVPKERRIRRS